MSRGAILVTSFIETIMKKIIVLGVIVTALLSSCGRFGNEDKKSHLKDRILSASKQHTEIMYALDADSTLVAVDVSSTYPREAMELPTVGYHMKLSFEGIMSVQPTVIIHKGGRYSIGPEHVVRQLNDLNVPLKTFKNKGTDIESTKKLIREMGNFFDRSDKADSLCSKLDTDMEKALLNREKYQDTTKVVVMHYGRANNIYLVLGEQSTAGKMVKWAGGTIPIKKKGMERITSPELIAKANPDIIFITGFGYDRLGSQEKILDLPGVALTNAAKNKRIYRIEAQDMIYLGPRTGENVLKLQKIIHES